tara:strand:+ start:2363 stop:2929 length:567 start_codon:yes stop_codon:yes gene_type:complete
MEDFQARQTAVQGIRGRVSKAAGNWLSDSECVQISIACACTEPLDVLGVLFTRHVTSQISSQIRDLSITSDEWTTLFAHDISHTRTLESSTAAGADMFKAECTKLSQALRSTIVETVQKTAWQRPVTRLAIYVGMHFENHEDAVASVIGGLVRSDLRRLEDLRAEMEERGVETMDLAQMVIALSVAAC